MHTFECPDQQDFQPRIVKQPGTPYKAATVIHLPQFAPIDPAADQSSQSPEHSLVDLTEDRLSQSLDSSWPDSEDDSLDTSLPDIPIVMEPVQLMNQLLTQLTTKPNSLYWNCCW